MNRDRISGLDLLLAKIEDPARREGIREAYHSLYNGDPSSMPVQFAIVTAFFTEVQVNTAKEQSDRLDKYLDEEGKRFEQMQRKHTGLLKVLVTAVCALVLALIFSIVRFEEGESVVSDPDNREVFYVEFSKMPAQTYRNEKTGVYRAVFKANSTENGSIK